MWYSHTCYQQTDAIGTTANLSASQNSHMQHQGQAETVDSSLTDIKMVSFNIWNVNPPWPERMRMLAEQVEVEDADIIGWQEVRYDWSKYR